MKSIVLGSAVTLVFFGICLIVDGLPVYDPSTGELYKDISTLEDIPGYNDTNGTQKQLYVIKAVVYEVGILTEVDENSTDLDDADSDGTVSQQVDLSFFDTHSNGTHIDFGDIPLPIQQQLNGQIITGIAPVHFGATDPKDILAQSDNFLPLTGAIFNITDSENAIINITTHAVSDAAKPSIVSDFDFADIPLVNNRPVFP